MKTAEQLIEEISKIQGGYCYNGAASTQYCFPLKAGGELRFSLTDADVGGSEEWEVDLYGAELPPCISGFACKTG